MANPISLTVRLQNTLNQSSLVIRCQEISQILQEVSSKDASYILRIVVESIFGVMEDTLGNGMQPSQIGGGWGLQIITLSEHRMEFETMRLFLSPRGPLLSLIYRLSHDPFQLFPFPISLLPAKVRSEILEGNAGPFYTSKIQNLGPGKTPTNIMLNAFEFYIFHFGFFLVPNNSQRWSFFWTSVRDSLYPTLLEDYLSAFLSCDASVPPGPPSPPVSPRGILSPVAQRIPSAQLYSTSGNLHNFGLLVSPIGRPFRTVESSPLMEGTSGAQTSSPLHCHSVNPQPEVNVWTSHVVIQVLMEIWINLCIPPPKVSGTQHTMSQTPAQSSLIAHPTLNDVFVPSSDHVRAVRMLIKHFHYFSNSLKTYQPSPLDPLRRNIWSMCRKSVYLFLKHLFTHWPLDSSFRLVLETWLSYIQPWRYVTYTHLERTPTKGFHENELRIIEIKWKGFMAENLLFYSHLFSLLLKRILRLDLASPKNAQILFRVAKVFSQENLVVMLHDIEHLLEANQLQKSFLGLVGGGLTTPSSTPFHQDAVHDGQPSPQTIIQLVRCHILEAEKPNYHHIPMFTANTPRDVYSLLDLAKAAYDAVTIELSSNSGLLSMSQRNGSKFDWFTSIWKNLFDSPHSREYENTLEEMQRCATHLDLSIKHFCLMFNINQPEGNLLRLSSDQQVTQFPPMMSHESSHLPDQRLTDVGPVLTNYGRCQLLSGMRRLDLKYEGDPDLKPICSFEITFLVRLLYLFTKYFNSKYAPEILNLYYRRDFIGSLARVIISPPVTVYEYKKDSGESPQKRIAKDLPPRMRLRFLANKRGLVFVICLYLLFSLFGFSFFRTTLQLIIPSVVTFLVCKAAIHRNKPPSIVDDAFSSEPSTYPSSSSCFASEAVVIPQKHLRF